MRTVIRASIDEFIFASTQVHFNYLITHSVLYCRPRMKRLCKICHISAMLYQLEMGRPVVVAATYE